MNCSLHFIVRHRCEKHQRVMQFIGVCRFGPCFPFHFVDRGGVENTQPVATPAAARLGSATRVNSLGAAFFQWRIIQKRIRPRIQNLRRERRRLRQIARDAAYLTVFDLAQNLF